MEEAHKSVRSFEYLDWMVRWMGESRKGKGFCRGRLVREYTLVAQEREQEIARIRVS